MKSLKYSLIIGLALMFAGCDYLDVVPDNVATVDNAFTMRLTAEKYLFTCYRYMPAHGALSSNPAVVAGDEYWYTYPWEGRFGGTGWNVARGNQSVTSPYLDYWDGSDRMYTGIRDCNIFLENIGKVPDMTEQEKNRWIGEVKCLKAYYHFYLVRMYGPIPVIRENLPISAGVEEVKVKREPVDDCVNYIVQLLDEAAPLLPDQITEVLTELGRITRPVALSLKALVLTTAASPMFNGNPDYTGFTNKDGTQLFNTTYQVEKWTKAANACKDAMDVCLQTGMKLYSAYNDMTFFALTEETKTQMSIRNSMCERWNGEIIWANTNSTSYEIQRYATPSGLDPTKFVNESTLGYMAPPLRIAEQFYTKNGVPISEDKNWDYEGRLNLRKATDAEKYHLQSGYTTAALHFDREPRFYASLAFDGGLWYGQGKLNDNDQWKIQCKAGQLQVKFSVGFGSITGYWPKKVVHYKNIVGSGNTYTIESYPWPVMRLADLYLLYAEALNEANGPSPEVYQWINPVRERAGLLSVEESWTQFSNEPEKYKSKEGLRSIIQQERLNELAFEGHRFWDLRRWKRTQAEMNKPIRGWYTDQSEAQYYYRENVLFKPVFMMRDYLWPIRENNLLVNRNLVQNPGW